MRLSDDALTFSATDLSNFFECEHRLGLELRVAAGALRRPQQSELERELLEWRGREHEQRVVEWFRAQGKQVRSPELASSGGPAVATEALMRAGVEVIYQGTLQVARWLGRPDFLVRVQGKSRFGDFKYDPADAKLAREAKGRAVLQLCVYADLLDATQDAAPSCLWLVPGANQISPLALPWGHFSSYYRRAKQGFLEASARREESLPYPDPVAHCDVCPWWRRCEEKRRSDDHPSLIAGCDRQQRERFREAQRETLASIAELGLGTQVPGLRRETVARIVDQAQIQLEGRRQGKVLHRRLPVLDEPTGLALLPEPSPGDLFLDLEGDAYFEGEGLEYLFGLFELGILDEYSGFGVESPERYTAFWAMTRDEERRAFERVIDAIARRWQEYPTLHVYHFGHRESTALKRLASRHGTRVDEVAALLREGVLVDLHQITRQGIRAAVESYSLKQLEGLENYGFARKTPVREAARAMQQLGFWLETGEARSSPEPLRITIERYNEEDCRSTRALRDWLQVQRELLLRERCAGLPRKGDPESKQPSGKRLEERRETADLVAALLGDLPDATATHTDEQAARRLLAHLLEWHRRELEPAYWEYFRARDLPEDERIEDRVVIGGLQFVRSEPHGGPRSQSDRYIYTFPSQEHGVRAGKVAEEPPSCQRAGEVLEVGADYVHLKRGRGVANHPVALMPEGPIDTPQHRASLRRLARAVLELGFDGAGAFRAARDLLLRRPRISGRAPGEPLANSGEDAKSALSRLALRLDSSVLAVQGPPGSGKTTAGAKTIVDLILAGRRVGIVANSHHVILNLLRATLVAADKQGLTIRALHIGSEDNLDGEAVHFELSKKYEQIARRLADRELHLVGGTAWAWAREDMARSVDVLVVDEAGQMSLANVLAIAQAAANLILLGDPNQLEQPQKGSHPDGADVSALEHLLHGEPIMPAERGLFLPQTWRLHPEICAFTSEVFYAGQLTAEPSLARQQVSGAGPLSGSGLRFVPVEHRGRTNHAPEEVERIAELLERLFAGSPRFTDRDGKERALTREDVLIVAPYNVQVAELKKRLPEHRERIGTVDKFQGKQAPMVIYSMTASSAEDAPRGMAFLFNLNRLNVATSRAQAVVAVVASPTLALARCRLPRQMQMANALCAYLERAQSP